MWGVLERSSFRWRAALAFAVGVGWACAFPSVGIAGFGWLVPGALLAVSFGRPGGEVFRLGYVAGLGHFLTAYYWLLYIPVTLAPIVGWLALAAFLALYPAAWVWLAWKSFPGSFKPGDARWSAASREFLATTPGQRTVWALVGAAAWVALEMIRARFLGGFP